jgi:glycosyltransferase involved in cell wall biosynthesis
MSADNIMVSVIMLAYNHEAYVSEAIASVLMQECSFPYELLIGEDNSVDHTRKIVKKSAAEHPDMIRLLLSEENLGAIENELRCLKAAKGKYVCFLEGDDFWVDKNKLQKQVDFLEANPDYGLVHGDVNHLNQDTGELTESYNRKNRINIPRGYIFDYLILPSHLIKTMTVCLRKELIENHYLQDKGIMSQEWKLIDISIWLVLAYHSKFYYFDEVFATYRLLPESMSRTKDNVKQYAFHQKIHSIRKYFANRYEVSESVKAKIKSHFYMTALVDAYKLNNKELAVKSYTYLRRNNIRIPLKYCMLYYGTKYPLLRLILMGIINK